MVDQQPAFVHADGRRAAADFQFLERELAEGHQPVIAHVHQVAQVPLDVGHGHVGDPDAGAIVRDAGGQVLAFAGADPAQVPHGAVQHGVGGHAVGVVHRFREEHRILVGEQVQVHGEVGLVLEEAGAQPLPAPQVLGMGEREAGTQRAVGHIGHEVLAQGGHPGGARVLGAGVVQAAFPALVRGQDHSFAFHAGGHAVVVDDHFGEPHAGYVARRHEPRQQVQPAVRAAAAGGVEDALRFEVVAGFRRHDDPGTGEGERDSRQC